MSGDAEVNKRTVGITVVSYVLGFLAQGLFFLLLARFLGASEFGLYAGTLAIAMMVATLSGLGSGNVLVSIVSKRRDQYASQLGTSLVYIAFSAAVIGPITYFAVSSYSSELITTLPPVLLAEVLFGRAFDLGLQVFQAFDRLEGTALFNVLAGVARLVAVLIFAVTTSHNSAAVWSFWYLGVSAVLASSIVVTITMIYGRPAFVGESLRTTWRTGIYFALGMSSRNAYVDGDKFVLTSLGFTADSGVFAAGARILNMAFTPIQSAVYASNTQLFRLGHASYEELWTLVRKLLRIIVLYACAAMLLAVVCAPVVPMILGSDYDETASVIVWLSPILLLQGLHYLFGDALMAAGRQRARSVVQVGIAVLSVAANFIVVPTYRWRGAAVVSLTSAGLLALFLAGTFAISLTRERRSANSQRLENAGDVPSDRDFPT